MGENNTQKLSQSKIAIDADVVNQVTGEKWYYSDIVKDHFFNPRNLMLEEPDESQYDAVGMVGSPACLASTTKVMTNPSVMTMDCIGTGEKVLGHDSQYHKVDRVFKVTYPPTELIRIRNYLGDITATADHLVYAKQIPKSLTFRHNTYKRRVVSTWVHAGDLKRGDITLYPLPTEVKPVKDIEFFMEKSCWDFRSRSIPEKVAITPDLLELFGYFISEGSTKKTEVIFTFSNKERHLVERVGDLIKSIFGLRIHAQERTKEHRFDVSVYNVHLANNFRRLFGTHAENKRIPESLLFSEPNLQRGLLKGLWLGDGYFATWRKQPRAGYATVSPILLHQVIFLLLRQLIIPSIFKERAKKIRGVDHKIVYRIHVGDMGSLERLAAIVGLSFKKDSFKRHEIRVWFEDNYVCLPIKKVGRIKFDGGRLYNFEVAGSHTYSTDAFLVHNCGDMMRMWLKIEPQSEQIQEMKWRTFGCGSAIAATSMFSVMVTENGGLPMGEALKIKPQHIMDRLGGLPNRKIHCSVLADKAFRKAANDYFRRTKQYQRIIIEGARVVDPKLNITDHDIEEAVLEGAVDLDGVQKKLKVGVGSPEIITEIEQLIRFYREKYYG